MLLEAISGYLQCEERTSPGISGGYPFCGCISAAIIVSIAMTRHGMTHDPSGKYIHKATIVCNMSDNMCHESAGKCNPVPEVIPPYGMFASCTGSQMGAFVADAVDTCTAMHGCPNEKQRGPMRWLATSLIGDGATEIVDDGWMITNVSSFTDMAFISTCNGLSTDDRIGLDAYTRRLQVLRLPMYSEPTSAPEPVRAIDYHGPSKGLPTPDLETKSSGDPLGVEPGMTECHAPNDRSTVSQLKKSRRMPMRQ